MRVYGGMRDARLHPRPATVAALVRAVAAAVEAVRHALRVARHARRHVRRARHLDQPHLLHKVLPRLHVVLPRVERHRRLAVDCSGSP